MYISFRDFPATPVYSDNTVYLPSLPHAIMDPIRRPLIDVGPRSARNHELRPTIRALIATKAQDGVKPA